MQKPNHFSKLVLLLAFFILTVGSLLHFRLGTYFNQAGHAWGPDDAFISYRYAQNLSLGDGLVFNPGEYVEGYSNLLLVLLASLLLYSGIDYTNLYFGVTLFNICVALLLLFTFYKLLGKHFEHEKAAIGAFILSLSPLMWLWTSAGMEIPWVLLFQLFIWMASIQLVERNSRIYSVVWLSASLLLCLTRADGFIYPVISLLYLVLKRRYHTFIFLLLTLVFIVGAITFWRFYYYGQLLPNTYYVKVSGPIIARLRFATNLLFYITFNQGFFGYLASIALSCYSLVRKWFSLRSPIVQNLRFDSFASLAWLAYWFYIGGDLFLERFLMILIPLSIFSLLSITSKLSKRSGMLLVAVFIMVQTSIFLVDPRFHYKLHKYDSWVSLGNYLRQHYHGQTIAADAVGKISYYSGMYTIDMLGLNDLHIARTHITNFFPGHNKYDPKYIFARQPDLISAWMANCPEQDCNRLDLQYGLSEEKYLQAGYNLAYLVYSGTHQPHEWLIEVSKFKRHEKLTLVEQGFFYAVLKKSLDE